MFSSLPSNAVYASPFDSYRAPTSAGPGANFGAYSTPAPPAMLFTPGVPPPPMYSTSQPQSNLPAVRPLSMCNDYMLAGAAAATTAATRPSAQQPLNAHCWPMGRGAAPAAAPPTAVGEGMPWRDRLVVEMAALYDAMLIPDQMALFDSLVDQAATKIVEKSLPPDLLRDGAPINPALLLSTINLLPPPPLVDSKFMPEPLPPPMLASQLLQQVPTMEPCPAGMKLPVQSGQPTPPAFPAKMLACQIPQPAPPPFYTGRIATVEPPPPFRNVMRYRPHASAAANRAPTNQLLRTPMPLYDHKLVHEQARLIDTNSLFATAAHEQERAAVDRAREAIQQRLTQEKGTSPMSWMLETDEEKDCRDVEKPPSRWQLKCQTSSDYLDDSPTSDQESELEAIISSRASQEDEQITDESVCYPVRQLFEKYATAAMADRARLGLPQPAPSHSTSVAAGKKRSSNRRRASAATATRAARVQPPPKPTALSAAEARAFSDFQARSSQEMSAQAIDDYVVQSLMQNEYERELQRTLANGGYRNLPPSLLYSPSSSF